MGEFCEEINRSYIFLIIYCDYIMFFEGVFKKIKCYVCNFKIEYFDFIFYRLFFLR